MTEERRNELCAAKDKLKAAYPQHTVGIGDCLYIYVKKKSELKQPFPKEIDGIDVEVRFMGQVKAQPARKK